MLISAVGQTVEKQIFNMADGRPYWILAPKKFRPPFREGHPRLFSKLTLKEHKSIEKRTFALHGHGSPPDDPTNSLCVFCAVLRNFNDITTPTDASEYNLFYTYMGTLCMCYTIFFDFLKVPHGSTRIASISGVDVRRIPVAHNEIDVMTLRLHVDWIHLSNNAGRLNRILSNEQQLPKLCLGSQIWLIALGSFPVVSSTPL